MQAIVPAAYASGSLPHGRNASKRPARGRTRKKQLDAPARFSAFVKLKLVICAPIPEPPEIGFFMGRNRFIAPLREGWCTHPCAHYCTNGTGGAAQ
jgi:hypothetical protein